MSEPGPIETIAIKALIAERVRVLGRLDGAFKRLQFAESQVATETALTAEYLNDIETLNAAIVLLGGTIPPDEPGTIPPEPSGAEPLSAPFVEEVTVTDTMGTDAGTTVADTPPDTPPPAPTGDLDPPPQTLALNVDDSVDTADGLS